MMGVCNVMGILLMLAFVINLVMYIWAYFGVPPLPLFDVQGGVASYYIFIRTMATYIFLYMVVGASAAMIKGSKLPENFGK